MREMYRDCPSLAVEEKLAFVCKASKEDGKSPCSFKEEFYEIYFEGRGIRSPTARRQWFNYSFRKSINHMLQWC